MNLSHLWNGLGVVALVACVVATEKISEPKKRPDRVVVTYWAGWTDFEADAMQKVVDAFNARQDKIWVDYLSVSNADEKTMMATAGGIPPDVASLVGTNLPLYAYYRAIQPLDDLCRQAGIKTSDYIPACIDICRYRGKVYSLPTTPATTALHYNKKLLREAGLNPDKPPATIEELDAMDEKVMLRGTDGKVKRAGFLPTEPGWFPWSWPYFFGGSLMADDGQITTDQPQNVAAYTWMQNYAKRYGVNQVQTFKQGFGQFNSPQNPFLDGRVASVLQGVWMANFIQKYVPDLDWGASPFPVPASHPELVGKVIVDMDIIVLPRGSKHAKEGFEFIKFVQSREGMELLCMGQKKFSPLIDVSPEFYAKHPNPYVRMFRDQALDKNAFAAPKTPVWGQYLQELQAAIDKINLLEDPKTCLAAVRKRVQPMQDEVEKVEKLRHGLGD
ncbi:MAG: ABC transporter substrate-binding protein [Armatimonadetes bacterium]|nr:ABC transporter substrate-binding protein [Armatimonadota bacterium]